MKNTRIRKIIARLGDDTERLEGLEEIRIFMDATMSRRTFYRHHREALRPYLLERRCPWKKRLPRYFSYKRLIIAYMLRRKII